MTCSIGDAGSWRIVLPTDIDVQLDSAMRAFWDMRRGQQQAQGSRGGIDRGQRAAVTGGKQMDGFVELIVDLLQLNGVPSDAIFCNSRLELPGFFRPTKRWDLLVVRQGRLEAAMELKSQVGPSFGNNLNNRVEEAVGSATDIWKAYRDGAFGRNRRPWLGYMFLLEDCQASNAVVSVNEPHFRVFPEFRGASYIARYEEFCRRLVREKLYDEVTFFTSSWDPSSGTTLNQPASDLAFGP